MKSEKQGHFVFYGAMVSEGIIALIWAAAGCALYTITDGKMVGLAEALAAKGIELDRKLIAVEGIKTVGEYEATAKLHKEVKAVIKFSVTAAE